MDYKLDYMARLFRKIRNKRFESYSIQRIWHKLDDPRVRFVTQQYFKRQDNGSYALADLYLPQIKLVVEVDEGQHNIIENTVLDALRSNEIQAIDESITIKRIPICKTVNNSSGTEEIVWNSLNDVNKCIDDIVDYIKAEIIRLGPDFKPWEGDDLLSVSYHQKKGYFSVNENDYIRTIDDAAAIFGTKAKHKGFLRSAGFLIPGKKDFIVWCPVINNKVWENKLLDNGHIITEVHKTANHNEREKHYRNAVSSGESRVTFFKEKDDLGFYFYRFVGVFKADLAKSIKEDKTVWVKVADRYDF